MSIWRWVSPWSQLHELFFNPDLVTTLGSTTPRCMRVSFSHPVWLRDPVCCLLPSGADPGSGQQRVRDPSGRLENHHPVPPHRAGEGAGHRRLAAHSSRHRYIGRCDKCEMLFELSLFISHIGENCENGVANPFPDFIIFTRCLNRR